MIDPVPLWGIDEIRLVTKTTEILPVEFGYGFRTPARHLTPGPIVRVMLLTEFILA